MKDAREYAEVGHGLPAVIDAEGLFAAIVAETQSTAKPSQASPRKMLVSTFQKLDVQTMVSERESPPYTNPWSN